MLSALIMGTAGFAVLFLYDFAQVRNWSRRAVSWLGYPGYAGITAGYVLLIVSAPRRATPSSIVWILGCAAALMFVLLVYSVLIEIPLYSARKWLPPGTVYDSGTYRIVRHPGFLWFLFMTGLLMLLFRSRGFTAVSGLFVVLNFLLVLAEDAVFFPRIFRDYAGYRKRVPFLVPRLGLNKPNRTMTR